MIPLYKVRDFGDSINATFEFIRENAKKLFLSVLFSSGTFAVFLSIAYISFYQTLWAGGESGGINTGSMLSGIAIVLFAFLLPITVISTVLQYMLRYFELGGSSKIEVQDIVTRSFKNIGSVFVLVFVYYLLAGVGTLFCIIPGVYLAVTLAPVYMIHAVEKRSIFDSFTTCLNSYSSGWWLSFGLYVVLSMILGFAVGIFSIPSAFLSVLSLSLGDEYPWVKPLSMLFQVLQNLANIFVYSVMMVAVFFRYGSLREGNEAIAFKMKVNAIGQKKAETNETQDLRKRGYIDEDEDY